MRAAALITFVGKSQEATRYSKLMQNINAKKNNEQMHSEIPKQVYCWSYFTRTPKILADSIHLDLCVGNETERSCNSPWPDIHIWLAIGMQ